MRGLCGAVLSLSLEGLAHSAVVFAVLSLSLDGQAHSAEISAVLSLSLDGQAHSAEMSAVRSPHSTAPIRPSQPPKSALLPASRPTTTETTETTETTDHNRFPVSDAYLRQMATIAEERIERLAALARDATRAREFDRGREYVRLARRLAERNRCGLPRRFDRFTCDRCDAALVPGVNARVRLQEGSHVVIRCDCGATDRYPYE